MAQLFDTDQITQFSISHTENMKDRLQIVWFSVFKHDSLGMKNLPEYMFLHIQPLLLNSFSCEETHSAAGLAAKHSQLVRNGTESTQDSSMYLKKVKTSFLPHCEGIFLLLRKSILASASLSEFDIGLLSHILSIVFFFFFFILITESAGCDDVEINKDLARRQQENRAQSRV